jgi:serine/threonine protein kinase
MSAGESPTPAASTRAVDEPPVQEIAAGTLVSNRYRVVDSIGEGAMGAVYRVEDMRTQKPMALKVLHASMSSQREAVARFEREAIAAGKIGHRNVAAATDFGRMPDGSFFILLEFVAGRSLRAELDHGPLEPRRAIRIMQGVVAGVAAAHAKGIVHRDLKPENIMLVDFDGDPDFVKVLDFGIAKVTDVCSAGHGNVAQTLTKAGTVIGTPDYMSPEQALGRAVDARSDLYSLGVVLYELLAGSAPFRGSAATLLRQQVLELPPPLPDEVTVGGDPTLEEMLRKLLAKKPEDRFQTAAELMAVLDTVASTLAAKGVLRDFGLRDRGLGAGRILRRLLRHLPRSSVARLSGLRVAMALGLLLAAMTAVLVLAFRSASDPSSGSQPPRVEGELPSESPASGTVPASPPEEPLHGAANEALPSSPLHVAPARKATSPPPPAPRAPRAPGSRKPGTRAAPVRD